jgi:heme-degrading monooxygenase HmoA
MYISVRVYRAKREGVSELNRRVQEEFVPLVSRLPGFVSYFGVDQGDGKWASISVFQTEDAVRASNKAAAEWVEKRARPLIESGPDTTTGTVAVTGTGQRDVLIEQPPRTH